MEKMTRREFLETTPKMVAAAAAITGIAGASPARAEQKPNILLIMVDQMQTPPEGYDHDEGVARG